MAICSLVEITSRLSKSKDFQFTTDQDGNMVIIALAERAGGVLGGRWAKSIAKGTLLKANMYLGFGTIEKTEGAIVIDKYPSKEQREKWQKSQPAIYSNKNQAENLSEGRNATLYRLAYGETNHDDLSRVRAEEGEGKDEKKITMIGRDKELEKLRTLTSQKDPARLILANGVPGVGKTTIVEELAEEQPNSIFIKMDANGENLPGAGIIQFAEKLAEIANARLDSTQKDQYKGVLSPLNDFAAKSIPEKLDDASDDILVISIQKTCVDVLRILELTQGSFTLNIDDTHHIDRHSDEHLMNLAYQFIEETDSKVVLVQRHEDRYKSTAQKGLIKRVKRLKIRKTRTSKETADENPNIGTLNVEGLNFKDPEISKPYALRFIPKDLLINKATGQQREIGNWILDLAKGTDIPLDMDDRLMQLAKDPTNFIPNGNILNAKTEAIKKILEEFNTVTDLGVLMAKRVEGLEPKVRLAFQCLSIIRRPLSAEELVDLVKTIQRKLPSSPQEPLDIIELMANNYIIATDGSHAKELKPETPLRLRHEILQEAVRANMTDDERYYLGNYTIDEFKERGITLHPDEKFALLHLTSSKRTTETAHSNFWETYGDQAKVCIKAAEETNSHRRAHQIASTILGSANGKKTVIGEEIDKMIDQTSEAPESVKKLVVLALTTILKTNAELGRHQKALRYLETVESLNKTCPDLSINMAEAYKHAFKSANVLNKNEEMIRINEALKELDALTPNEAFMMDIRIAYKKAINEGNFGIYLATIAKHKTTLRAIQTERGNAYCEYARLNARATLERVIANIRKAKVDQDAELDPGLLGPNATSQLLGNRDLLEMFKRQQKADPNTFSPEDELSLYELYGQINGQLGLYEEAAECLGEAWRVAMQMGDHHQAGRIAKSKSQCELLRASLVTEPAHKKKGAEGTEYIPGKIIKVREKGELSRTLIRRSIQTITEMGLPLIDDESGLERKSDLHVFMRIQRLGSISSLLDSYDDLINPTEEGYQLEEAAEFGEKDEMKSEIKTCIAMAIEDLNTLKELIDEMPDLKAIVEANHGIYPYYTDAFATHIVDSAKKLHIPTNNLKMDSAFFRPEMIEFAIQHGESRRPDNMGVNAKKKRHLRKASEILQNTG